MNRKPHRKLLRIAATGLIAFVLTGILIMVFPKAYPNLLVQALKVMSPRFPIGVPTT